MQTWLSTGGMGVTYLVTDRDGRWALAKILRDDLCHDRQHLSRFEAEVELLRSLAPGLTADLLDAGTHAGCPYLVTEYLAGPTLQQQVSSAGSLSAVDAIRLAADLARTLAAIHERGIVHRDLKPSNVVLTFGGARLIDFGIAQWRTRSGFGSDGDVVGTPGWLAPEQLSHGSIGPPADVYGLAATVIYATIGRRRDSGSRDGMLTGYLDAAGVPCGISHVLTRALDPSPLRRPPAAEILSVILQEQTELSDSGSIASARTTRHAARTGAGNWETGFPTTRQAPYVFPKAASPKHPLVITTARRTTRRDLTAVTELASSPMRPQPVSNAVAVLLPSSPEPTLVNVCVAATMATLSALFAVLWVLLRIAASIVGAGVLFGGLYYFFYCFNLVAASQ